MKLENLCNISTGVVLSRIETTANTGTKYPLFTMQALSYELGQYSLKVDKQEITVEDKKLDKKLLAKIGGVIVGLSSYKTVVVDSNHVGKIIPSNFAYIELDQTVIEPYYFSWYFNEHPHVRKHLRIISQGSALRTLTIQMLKEIEITIPPLDIQKKIGIVYRLRKLREKLWYEKNILEEQLSNQTIVNKMKENK